MGCCGNSTEDSGDNDTNHPDNKKMSGEGWTSLRERKRHCTDCLCLILLICCWIAMTAVGFVVTGVIEDSHLDKGNPARLTNAIDYDGRICGASSGVKDRPNAYYLTSGAVICVKSCPRKTDFTEFICYDDKQAAADANETTAWRLVGKQKCMYEAKTEEFLNRCLYQKDKSVNSSSAEAAASEYVDLDQVSIPSSYSDSDSGTWATGFFADMYELRGYIFGFGIGIAVFLALGYLYFLRIPGVLFLMIWSIIVGIGAVLFVGSVMLYSLAQQWAQDEDRSKDEATTLQVVSIVGFVIFALYICLICVMRKRIMLAIGIVKEASRAVSAMPILCLMPVFQCAAVVIFLVPWTIYSIYLASSGDVKTEEVQADGETTQYKTIEYNNNTRLAFLYLLFCWFWTSQFVVAAGQIMSALSFSAWYFTRDKKTEGNSTVFWAFRVTFFNHLGTAAYGSLVIAIIKTIRAVLAYLQRKAKKSGNQLALCILRVLQCCMWCLEKCMKFLNKNAYIQTAINGYSFCKACRAAFFLIARNVLRVIAVSYVGDFVLFLGKIFIPLVTTFLCYLALGYFIGDSVHGLIGPLLIVFFLSFFVASLFVEVFGMAISTILMCYCADEEMFPPEERFADGALRGAIKKTQQSAADAKVGPEVKEEEANKEDNEKGEVLL